jgi:hypothetical protein
MAVSNKVCDLNLAAKAMAVVLFLAIPLTSNADFKMPAMPANPLTPDQTACMKKAIGSNFKPSAKQLADATKGCVSPPAAAKPAAAAAPAKAPPAAAAPAAAKPAAPAKSDDSDE